MASPSPRASLAPHTALLNLLGEASPPPPPQVNPGAIPSRTPYPHSGFWALAQAGLSSWGSPTLALLQEDSFYPFTTP